MHGSSTTRRQLPLSPDAALVVALAGTALPFAQTAEDEAERWLRAMRLHGQVGSALQALGVGEVSLSAEADPAHSPPRGDEALSQVSARAAQAAQARQADAIGTADVLSAVVDVYGEPFEHALYLRGTSFSELRERLASTPAGG
ncbi:MAG TPA: hypothetical protein VEQ61_01725 [Thermoleophilaceae bacterium]|nr:hypothetical protein [Thermoleophilaceae bacterium]